MFASILTIVSLVLRILGWCLPLLWTLTACADGREILGPWDPQYQAVCVDSTVTMPERVCRMGTIALEIPNPLYPDTLPDSAVVP